MNVETIDPKAICGNCGKRASAHHLANYADGPHIGVNVLICPTATWRQAQTGERD